MQKIQFFDFSKALPRNIITSLQQHHISAIPDEACPIVKDVLYAVIIVCEAENVYTLESVMELISDPTFVQRLKLI